jgi:hypothetical protein
MFDFYFSKNSFYFLIKEMNKNINKLLKLYFNKGQVQIPIVTGLFHAVANTCYGDSKLSNFPGMRLILY